ncbi:MAG: flagellar export protein FliJ [Armatimonadetes bacterium]|nr:flagellar export protein FliJ [Armatimonadota bacterium]
MRKFEFRLQKVLDYRRLCEDWAKQAYIESQARLLDGQDEVRTIAHRREKAIAHTPHSVNGMVSLEQYLVKLDDDQRAQEAVNSILEQEVESARQDWVSARQDAEAIQKLHDREWEDYQTEVLREEQKALDEFANYRRAA